MSCSLDLQGPFSVWVMLWCRQSNLYLALTEITTKHGSTVPSIQCWYLITRPYIAMSIYREIGEYLNSIFPRLSEIPISIVCIVLELRLNKQKIIQTIDELSLQMLHILGFDPRVFRESLRFVIHILVPRLFFLILSYPIQQNICEI